MRYLLGVAGLLTLAACAVEVPDSAAGVQDRTAAITQAPISATGPVMPTDQSTPGGPAIPGSAAYAAAAANPPAASQPANPPATAGEADDAVRKFALSVYNEKGQALYSRSKFLANARYNRNCRKYATADQAQAAFLARGGPERDPMGIDPDGDGFACTWDPAPYRKALDPSELAEQPVVVRSGQ